MIIEEEQRGNERAEYGKHIIQELSERLTSYALYTKARKPPQS